MLNKEITIEDLMKRKITKQYKNLWKETGSWVSCRNKYDINYSSILTKLIQEAGRLCDCYASDLFISWNEIEKSLKIHEKSKEVFLFGFRKMGVDHKEWVMNRINGISCGGSKEYRSLWCLEVEKDKEKITMDLSEIML